MDISGAFGFWLRLGMVKRGAFIHHAKVYQNDMQLSTLNFYGCGGGFAAVVRHGAPWCMLRAASATASVLCCKIAHCHIGGGFSVFFTAAAADRAIVAFSPMARFFLPWLEFFQHSSLFSVSNK